jgi:molecular chaperone DnaK (HSP70)
LEIDSLVEVEDFEQIIKKDILNVLCNNLLEKCLQILKVTLNNPALTINEINDVVLLGGSS